MSNIVKVPKKQVLLQIPMGKLIAVRGFEGTHYMSAERYGKCQSCAERVVYCREKPRDMWVPVQLNMEELHRCPGEMKRNPVLRRIVNGQQPEQKNEEE